MSKHIKRLTIPKSWKIPKKEVKWAVKVSPGKHPQKSSMPLGMVLRDMLGYADNMREARRIIGSRKILVDGKVEIDHKAPVGFMDVISIPESNEHYRMLFDAKGRLTLIQIDDERAKWKLVRIDNKTYVRGGRVQLNLHDGRNILVDRDKDVYKTGDVLKIAIPEQKIIRHIPLKEGNKAMIIGGTHGGSLATVKKYEIIRGPEPNMVSFEEGFSTIKDYVFIVGTETPEVKIPEVKV
jgi:small subunit ribosomal protein S4e